MFKRSKLKQNIWKLLKQKVLIYMTQLLFQFLVCEHFQDFELLGPIWDRKKCQNLEHFLGQKSLFLLSTDWVAMGAADQD